MSKIEPIRAAAVVDGIVVNVEMIEPGFERDGVIYVPSDTAGIGDRFKGGEFIRPEIETQPEPVPEEVTMRQARLALLGAGILDEAEAAIAGLTGAEGRAAHIEWEYAAVLRRDHPLVAALGNGLGLDDEAKDALFRSAATL